MNYKEYLTEEVKQIEPELEKAFNEALQEVFTRSYLLRIQKKLKDFLEIQEVDESDNVVAYNIGSKIYINKNTFYELSRKAQARYLLHEFIHVLQRKRGLLFSKFKDIRDLTINIYNILRKHSDQPISVFLTGRNVNLGKGGKWEVLSYFMNNSINWNAVSKEGAELIKREIRNSGVFNTDSDFWKRRLP